MPSSSNIDTRKKWWSKQSYSKQFESFLEIIIPSYQSVQCVRVFSDKNYQAKWIQAELEGELNMTEFTTSKNKNIVKKWETKQECSKSSSDYSYGQVLSQFSCHELVLSHGEKGKKITGDIVEVPVLNGELKFLEFSKISGPLQCLLRCELFLDEGCKHYNYDIQTQYCWLYSNIHSYKSSDYMISGSISPRFSVKTEPEILKSDMAFSLIVEFKKKFLDSKDSKRIQDFQRIKLIEYHDDDDDDENNDSNCITQDQSSLIENIFCSETQQQHEIQPGLFIEQIAVSCVFPESNTPQ